MKKEEETKSKLERLTQSIGPLSQPTPPPSQTSKPVFKTSEVVVLLLITTIVSLAMGALFLYKYTENTKTDDKKLNNFIKNYNYIIKNYNGQIDKEELLDAALEGMLTKLDKNSSYLESNESENFNKVLEGSYDGIGIQIFQEESKIIINAVFENSPAAKAGLKSGDVITKINGESTKNMTTKQVVEKVKKSKTKAIKLTINRDKEEKTITVDLDKVNIKSVSSKTYEKNNKKIGYIYVSIFANNTYNQFHNQLNKLEEEKIDGLIIDLRANSGGYLSSAENMISLFLDSSHVIYQIEKGKTKTKHYSVGHVTKKYKIAILVDHNSASASEVMTSALSEQYGAVVIGTTTFGKGTVQELQDLKNGDKYKLTTKNWLTSKGKWIDGKGFKPDIEIELSEKYLETEDEKDDNQLNKAIEELSK